ncbi:MarR family winged helix-turn-helix transcriptional regulator [Flavihumibacter sp.]|uniref:MarR family winged helix-turn-helix transcriptional regulator n=1 Tax=Flavihumibacter sp. TaxID=1913981 RepID=UPI002FC69DA1|nr:MarR family transcriptional regulator [Flavihumibacter sediminis]
MKTTESRFSKCMYFSSGALARKIEKLAIESWKKIDLSPSHAYLLLMVLEDPGMQPGALADELQLSPSTITRLIEKLEEKKLVIRTTEGKLTNVYPTPRGKELLPQMKQCLAEFNERFGSVLGKEESTKLIHNINRITDKL